MFLDRLRAPLRDPFYRVECRQTRFWKTVGLWALALVPLVLGGALCAVPFMFLCCAMFGPLVAAALIPLLCLPAFLGAESVLLERDRATLEGLLLTTVRRDRIVLAKLLASQRHLVVLGLLLAGPAAAVTVSLAMLAWDHRPLAIWLGSVAVLVVALGVAGQSVACGSLGLLAALMGRTRGLSYLYAAGLTLAAGLVQSAVLGAAGYWGFISVMMMREGFNPVRTAQPPVPDEALAAVLGAVALAIFAVLFGLFNVLLPWLVVRQAARRMDGLLLKD